MTKTKTNTTTFLTDVGASVFIGYYFLISVFEWMKLTIELGFYVSDIVVVLIFGSMIYSIIRMVKLKGRE